ncbi:MAG: VWA domain-containing protein, partial [Novosphingobium sp.]
PATDDPETVATETAFEDNLLIDFSGVVSAADADGDTVTAAAGTFVVDVDDDMPTANDDNAGTVVQSVNVNAAFVLDFSGSVDNNELNIQLDAVKTAAYEIFAGTDGDVQIDVVVFSNVAQSYTGFMTYASFAAQIDSLNPQLGGTRPYDSTTNFTASIEELMDIYSPDPVENNQVFFISDGNPNQQTGTGGNSLADVTAADWADFINDYDVNVTTIGIGNGINVNRLQDVDLDGSGSPILVDDFEDLIESLIEAVSPPIGGNVLTNDSLGADDARVLSITIDSITYEWDGGTAITPSSGPSVPAGTKITVSTTIGGEFEFDFATGLWSYDAPPDYTGNDDELIDYVIIDGDGDTDGALLTIDVADVTGGSNFARNDVVITNQSGPGIEIAIPGAALLANDGAGTSITGVEDFGDADGATFGAGIITFDDNDSDGGYFTYGASQGLNSDTASVTVNRAQSGDNTLDGTSGEDILIARDANADTIYGSGGNDILYGLGGNDVLNGGAGNDMLIGGAGADQFRLQTNGGSDHIVDFVQGSDKIGFYDSGSNNNGSVNFSTSGSNGGTTLGSSDFETLSSISAMSNSNDQDVLVITSAQTQAQITGTTIGGSGSPNNNYVIVFNSDTGCGEIWFDNDWSDTNNRGLIATLNNVTTLGGITAIERSDIVVFNNSSPPIVIDLDGDGAEFSSLAAGVLYDYGQGLVATAWVGADDGLLAFDANGDGTVSGATEFVFGGNGQTDLEGLAENYDSNGDGVLNGDDAGWAQFGVWQDADQDGVADAGEFRSLADLGITEIQLTSDGEAYVAADGDVAVAGTATVTLSDGSTTTLADATFR